MQRREPADNLPGKKVSEKIAAVRGLKPGEPAISPSRFPDLGTVEELHDTTDSSESPALLKRVQVPLQVLDKVPPTQDGREAVPVNGGDQKPFDGTVS